MDNFFRCRRRLSSNDTRMITVGFTERQKKMMKEGFKNRSLPISFLTKWAIQDLIKESKTLKIRKDDEDFTFQVKEFDKNYVYYEDEGFMNRLKRVSVLIDNESMDFIDSVRGKVPYFKIIPALTMYAIEKLKKENKVFILDDNAKAHVFIKPTEEVI
ncbi:hypothetical protein [Pantoea eucrina]|uniref:hypothetical protein n=1 Tax=Pantoea eucrina TaxID=472693 RepID=UPI000A2644DD|nr:hypothetical protein [Pantoea eucrina]ORM76486.1 hypothetical protein HA43_14750 [Pantoea eucrina]